MNKITKKLRAFRIEDDLWSQAVRIAAERGESLSEVIREAVARYVKKNGSK